MNRKQRRIQESKGSNAAGPMTAEHNKLLVEAIGLHESGSLDGAETIYRKLIALYPKMAPLPNLLGMIQVKRGNHEEGIKLIGQAIALQPDYADAYMERGMAYEKIRKYEEAVADYNRAIAIKPTFADAYNLRGVALEGLKHYGDALASYNKAIALKPGFVQAYTNRGNALYGLGQWDAAMADYNYALAMKPDFAETHYNKALSLLLRGDLEHGWAEYEWRWKVDTVQPTHVVFSKPLWLGGENLAGKTILLYAEQGLGDALQFCRYAPMVEALGARVILIVQKPLLPLFTGFKGVSQVMTEGTVLPEYDFHCALLTLPFAFKTTLQNIPAEEKYFSASPAKLVQWQARLGEKTRPRIGLVWSGGTYHKNDRNRTIALSALIPHLPSAFQYISLQKELRDADRQTLMAHPELLYFGDELKDFSDTAALCELMDVVISVDTSVAHLSAALGRPTWILLPFIPDWRWLLGRGDSPWYPTVRLYRQEKIDDWGAVFERLTADLNKVK